MSEDKRFAVLIDADNVSDKYIKGILEEMTNYGIITYKRIYGDWTKPSLAPWKNVLLDNSITPIQQYSYTTGKNATDSAMIIDAMDILYSKNVEGFCLVSSDSDFTRLASRLRESGMYVVGMGEKKTPSAFVSACNLFKYLEILTKSSPANNTNSKKSDEQGASPASTDLLTVSITNIINDTSDEEGWSSLGEVGNLLIKRFPDFDTRNYGFNKLTPLVRSLKRFEVKSVKKQVYIRIKSDK